MPINTEQPIETECNAYIPQNVKRFWPSNWVGKCAQFKTSFQTKLALQNLKSTIYSKLDTKIFPKFHAEKMQTFQF
jgi:hypothetical protein